MNTSATPIAMVSAAQAPGRTCTWHLHMTMSTWHVHRLLRHRSARQRAPDTGECSYLHLFALAPCFLRVPRMHLAPAPVWKHDYACLLRNAVAEGSTALTTGVARGRSSFMRVRRRAQEAVPPLAQSTAARPPGLRPAAAIPASRTSRPDNARYLSCMNGRNKRKLV